MSQNQPEDTAREISPIRFMDDDPELDDNLYDFRPHNQITDLEEDEEVAPKASSAVEPADSSQSEMPPVTVSPDQLELPVVVEKVSTPPKGTATGKPSSSAQTKAG